MKNEKMYVGVDVGKNGAIVTIQGNEISTYKFPMIGKEYDTQAIFKFFGLLSKDTDIHVVIEDVHALQGAMKAGNFSLSRGKTIIEMSCIGNSIPFTMVHSKTWQKQVWQGIELQKKADGKTDTKLTSLLAIKRLYPNINLTKSDRSKKDDDGIVDALAMAHYCKMNF